MGLMAIQTGGPKRKKQKKCGNGDHGNYELMLSDLRRTMTNTQSQFISPDSIR